MQYTEHGDTLPSVFSINKKNLHFLSIVPFLPQGSLEPGSLDSEASALPLSYLAVDIRLGFTVLYICNMAAFGLDRRNGCEREGLKRPRLAFED